MTYLATEIVLHLLSAAGLGLILGWLIWGLGRRRALSKLNSEMSAKFKAEMSEMHQTRHALQSADAKLQQAVDAEKAQSSIAIAEVERRLEAEQAAAEEASTKFEELRAEMEDIVATEKTAASDAVDQAMRAAGVEKAAAGEAKEKEAQLRAEVEELRLMVGAEKLAAQTARTELDNIHAKMESALETERRTSAEARAALDDIQTTLARTFGHGAGIVAAISGEGTAPQSVDATAPGGAIRDDAIESSAIPPNLRSDAEDMSAIDVQPGSSFNLHNGSAAAHQNQDAANAKEVRSGDGEREQPDWAGLDSADSEDGENGELIPSPSIDDSSIEFPPSDPSNDEQMILGAQITSVAGSRSGLLLDHRPDEVDDLQEIDGIGSALEHALNERGCYQFRQLANFSAADFEWLSTEIESFPGPVERDRWIDQAKELHVDKYGEDQDGEASTSSTGKTATGS